MYRMKHGDWLCIWLGWKIGLEAEWMMELYGVSHNHYYRIVRKVNKWTPEYRMMLWKKAEEDE